jgi:RNA polymerase sigma-70 factor (ECF subfamily)
MSLKFHVTDAHPVDQGRTAMAETRTTLLRRLRDPADADAWREFVALYQPLLRAYVLKKAPAGPDADEVVQEVLARLFKALPDFELDRRRGRFRSWLWKVTASALADELRRRHRRKCAERAFAADDRAEPPRAADDEPEPDWVAMHHRRVLEFAKERVRARSHPRTWACFEEHVLRGRPSGEVAAELGVAANTVDVYSTRVLNRLRSYCRDYLEELADGDDPLPG